MEKKLASPKTGLGWDKHSPRAKAKPAWYRRHLFATLAGLHRQGHVMMQQMPSYAML